MNVNGNLKQVESRDAAELEFPRKVNGKAYTTYIVEAPAKDEYSEPATVALLAEVGSQEEENINIIMEANEEAIAAGQDPELDLQVQGMPIFPSLYKLGSTDQKYQPYRDAVSPLSIDDETEGYPDVYILCTSVDAHDADGEYYLNFSTSSANIYFEERTNSKTDEAFTSVKLSPTGWTIDGERSGGTFIASLNKGGVEKAVMGVYEEQMQEEEFLANNAASGTLGFKQKGDSDEVEPRFKITQVFIGKIINRSNRSSGISTQTSPAVAAKPKAQSDAKKSVRERMKQLAKTRQEKEAATNKGDF